MMFNKKMLGSCCVGLALLQSCDVFGVQRPLEVGNETSAKPTTATEVKNAHIELADLNKKITSQEHLLIEMAKCIAESQSTQYMSPELARLIEESQSPRKEIPAKESELKEHAPSETVGATEEKTFLGYVNHETEDLIRKITFQERLVTEMAKCLGIEDLISNIIHQE